MPNTNCLEDIKCPECGNDSEFRIESTGIATVTDDGADITGDLFWDENSFAHCPRCEREGKVADFREGQSDHMEKSSEQQPPPDPDGQNDDRAEWAARAVRAFRKATGCDEEDSLGDLLINLMHWAHRKGYDFAVALGRAQVHYASETASEAA